VERDDFPLSINIFFCPFKIWSWTPDNRHFSALRGVVDLVVRFLVGCAVDCNLLDLTGWTTNFEFPQTFRQPSLYSLCCLREFRTYESIDSAILYHEKIDSLRNRDRERNAPFANVVPGFSLWCWCGNSIVWTFFKISALSCLLVTRKLVVCTTADLLMWCWCVFR
jgi:hypothetical protein